MADEKTTNLHNLNNNDSGKKSAGSFAQESENQSLKEKTSESFSTISQARFDSLRNKHIESAKEVASYGDSEIPSSVLKRNNQINRLYSSIEDKIAKGSIIVVPNVPSSRSVHKDYSSSSQQQSFAKGSQAFSSIKKDVYSSASKRTGDSHIKPVGTPFQASPINKYDSLKIYNSHNYNEIFATATKRAVGALSNAMLIAARSEESGSVNMMITSQERMREVAYAAQVAKDLPRQMMVGAQRAQVVFCVAQNVGRFVQGKEIVNLPQNKPLTIRQIDKQLKKPFSSAETPRLQKKFGSNVNFSSSAIQRRIVIVTAKNKGLKNEINALQTKGSALTAEETKHLKSLIDEKKLADVKLRKLYGLKTAHTDAAVRNGTFDRLSKKSIEKTIKKSTKKNLHLSKRDKFSVSHMKDRIVLLEKRNKLLKAKQARKNLTFSIGMLLGNAARDSEDSGVQGILNADRFLQNRYLRSILRASTKAVMLPAKLSVKTTKGVAKVSYKTARVLDKRFNQGRIGSKIDTGVEAVKSVNRAVRTAGEEAVGHVVGHVVNSRAYKELNGGLYKKATQSIRSRTSNVFKTRRPLGNKNRTKNKAISNTNKAISNTNKAISNTVLRNFMAHIQNTVVGEFISTASTAVSNVMKYVKLFQLDFNLKLIAAALTILVPVLLGIVISSSGGAFSSLVLGKDTADGKIDLSYYVNTFNSCTEKFLADIDNLASDPDDKYEKVTVNYQNGTLVNNFKEIISMTAVYFEQDLSESNEENVQTYIKTLFNDSHYYTTIESEPYSCTGCESRTYNCTDSYDVYATPDRITLFNNYAERGGCVEHEHQLTEHCEGCVLEERTDVEYCEGCVQGEYGSMSCPGHTVIYHSYTCPGHVKIYYTYSCSGHSETICRGEHIDLDINIMVLGFDEIFYADSTVNSSIPSIDTSTGNINKGDVIGTFTVTYYCTEKYPHICNAGPPYKTASGTDVTPGRTIAVDTSVIPLGTHVIINGHEYIAEDTGGAIQGNRIDITVATHSEALQNGKKTYKVYSAVDGSSDESSQAARIVSIPYLDYANDAVAFHGMTKINCLELFGLAKEPSIKWHYGLSLVDTDTPEIFVKKLQQYDIEHKNEAFSNVELNTFEYLKMSKDELVALAKEKTGKDYSDLSVYYIIGYRLIPYDKEHPDEYVAEPDSSFVGALYFEGWTEANIEWVKNIYENLSDEHYDGLDKLNNYYGKNVSYEGIVFKQGETEVIYFNQYDIRWKNLPYSTSTIGVSGCGPTSMAMVISSLTNSSVDPIQMCNWAASEGYYVAGEGTAWSFIPAAASHWGLSCKDMGSGSAQAVVDALSNGKLVVMSTGSGSYYSGDGHFLVLRGISEDGKILVADPASKSKSDESWPLKDITSGLKNWWIIG